MSSLPMTVSEARAIIEADRLVGEAHNEFSDDETFAAWLRIVDAAKARVQGWQTRRSDYKTITLRTS